MIININICLIIGIGYNQIKNITIINNNIIKEEIIHQIILPFISITLKK